jgi:hypothetical protein
VCKCVAPCLNCELVNGELLNVVMLLVDWLFGCLLLLLGAWAAGLVQTCSGACLLAAWLLVPAALLLAGRLGCCSAACLAIWLFKLFKL